MKPMWKPEHDAALLSISDGTSVDEAARILSSVIGRDISPNAIRRRLDRLKRRVSRVPYLSPGKRPEMSTGDLARFWSKVNRCGPVVRPDLGPCWVWTGYIDRSIGGYGKFRLGERMRKVHVIAYEQANGPIPTITTTKHGACVLHRCDNPPCCKNVADDFGPSHLFVGDQRENVADRSRKGRDNPTALTESQARESLRRLALGETLTSIARDMGCSHETVARLRDGKIRRFQWVA